MSGKSCWTCKYSVGYDNAKFCEHVVGHCNIYYDKWEPVEEESNLNLSDIFSSLEKFLLTKNRKYGNSINEPVKVFSKTEANDQILNRIDDKLSRIKNSDELRKNDIVDLTGYLILLLNQKGWTDFDDLID